MQLHITAKHPNRHAGKCQTIRRLSPTESRRDNVFLLSVRDTLQRQAGSPLRCLQLEQWEEMTPRSPVLARLRKGILVFSWPEPYCASSWQIDPWIRACFSVSTAFIFRLMVEWLDLLCIVFLWMSNTTPKCHHLVCEWWYAWTETLGLQQKNVLSLRNTRKQIRYIWTILSRLSFTFLVCISYQHIY